MPTPPGRQIKVAAERGGGVIATRAEAAGLPFHPSSFDAVVACLVFEHIEDFDEAIAEVGRVLAPGGRFLLLLNHPLLQAPNSGWIDDTILDEQYWRIGPYLVEDSRLEEVEKDVWIPFIHRPLVEVHQRHGGGRPVPDLDGGAGAPAGLPGASPGIRRCRHHPSPAGAAGREAGHAARRRPSGAV